jgi:hypothetical protein
MHLAVAAYATTLLILSSIEEHVTWIGLSCIVNGANKSRSRELSPRGDIESFPRLVASHEMKFDKLLLKSFDSYYRHGLTTPLFWFFPLPCLTLTICICIGSKLARSFTYFLLSLVLGNWTTPPPKLNWKLIWAMRTFQLQLYRRWIIFNIYKVSGLRRWFQDNKFVIILVCRVRML